MLVFCCFFFFSSRRRHTRWNCDWSSDVCSSDLDGEQDRTGPHEYRQEEAAVIFSAARREIGAAERHRLPPHQRRAALVAQLNQAPRGVDPAARSGDQQQVIERTLCFTIPEEHGSQYTRAGLIVESRLEIRCPTPLLGNDRVPRRRG